MVYSAACTPLRCPSVVREDLTQVLWDELLTAVHDEHPPHIQLDVILLFLVLKEVEGRPTGDEEQGSELQLSLDGEVLWHRGKKLKKS